MFCPYCGTENADNSYRCSACGEPLHEQRRVPVHVPNYLVQSILVTLFCCQPFGIVAIVFSALTMTRADAGDLAGAQAYSEKARMWSTLAFWLGLLWVGACLLFFIAGGVLSH